MYSAIGTHRAASILEIDAIFDQYKECEHEFEESPCADFDRKIYKFDAATIKEIRRVLVDRPDMRELYDKNEIFMRKKYEQSMHNPS